MPDFDEGDHPRDEGGKFTSGGGSEKADKSGAERASAAKQVGQRVEGSMTKQLARFSGTLKDKSARMEKLRASVREETPKPPKGAPWKGDKDEADAETWYKYHAADSKKGDPKAPVTDRDRAELHEAITEHFMGKAESVPANEKPIAILTMGGPASGKSSMVRKIGIDDSRFVKVDPDGIKEKLPEYREGVTQKQRTAAANVHEESSALAKQIRDRAIGEHKNVLVDGTGADLGKMTDLINHLKDKGYHVRVLAMNVDHDTGMARAAKRAEETGRWVKTSFIDDAYQKIPQNTEPLTRMAHEFSIFDNSVEGQSAREVWNDKSIIDPSWVKGFQGKYTRL